MTEPEKDNRVGVSYVISWPTSSITVIPALLIQVTLMTSWVGVLYDQLTKVEKSEFVWSKISLGCVCILKMGCSCTTAPLLEPEEWLGMLIFPLGKYMCSSTLCGKSISMLEYIKVYEQWWIALLVGQGPRSRNIWIWRLKKYRQEVYDKSMGVDTSEIFRSTCYFPQEILNPEEVYFNNKVHRREEPRWRSRRTCSHSLLREHQNHS